MSNEIKATVQTVCAILGVLIAGIALGYVINQNIDTRIQSMKTSLIENERYKTILASQLAQMDTEQLISFNRLSSK